MRRMMLRMAAAVLTFAAGVAAAAFLPAGDVASARRLPAGKPERQDGPRPSSCFPGLSVKARPAGGRSSRFPAALSKHAQDNRFKVDWYSKHLAAMNEPPLAGYGVGGEERYRFLWLRTFHRPVAVTIWDTGEARFILAKELDGAGGYKPGNLILVQSRTVTEDEWDKFTDLLERACYWNMPTEESNPGGKDGARWILEGVKGGRYHIVDRWTPEGGSYRELCLYLLKLSGLEVGDEEVY